jgi:hypothetical protein
MRNKSIISVLIIIICYSLIISLCSCNKDENPVKPVDPPPPPSGPDTLSRYKWTIDDLRMTLRNLYVADTNKIYIQAFFGLILYNGTNWNSIINEPNIFQVRNVYGYGKNDIFVPGYTRKGYLYVPTIKKISNNNIQTYTYENEQNMSNDILVIGPDQAWFSSDYESKVYYYDNGNITVYRLSNNDSISAGTFYLDGNNNLFVFASDKRFNYFFGNLYVYKYEGNIFSLIKTYKLDYNSGESKSHFIWQCGKDAIMLPFQKNQKIYYFNGDDFIFHSNPTDSFLPYKIGGISKDSLVALSYWRNDMYTFGSNKWRRENSSPFILTADNEFSKIETKFGNIYLTNCDAYYLNGWISIGKPNKSIITQRLIKDIKIQDKIR